MPLFGGGKCNKPAIGRKVGMEARPSSRSQAAGGATLKRRFPEVILAGKHDFVFKYCGKAKVTPSYFFSISQMF